MSRSLISLAIVRTNWEKYKKDHIENFVPLVATLILEKEYASIGADNIYAISKEFQERFGLKLPSHPLEVVLKRMSKEGYLDKSSGEWKPVTEKLKELNITAKSKEIQRTFEALLQSIQDFAKIKLNTELKVEEIEEGLLAYLKRHDMDILFASNDGSVLPKARENKKLEFIIGMFIEDAEKSNPDAFKKLADISIGHALASTMLYDDFSVYSGKFKNLEIYFDTPWLFDLLGVRGNGRQEMAIELLSVAEQENASRKVLDVNQKEVITNLDICLQDFVKNNPVEKASRTYKLCKMSDLTESDVRDFLTRLNDIFTNDYGLELDTVPDFNENAKHQIDENELYDTIVRTYNEQKVINVIEEMDLIEKAHIKEIGQEHVSIIQSKQVELSAAKDKLNENSKKKPEEIERDNRTILRDVDSLSGIYRMRKGVSARTLKDSKAIFVTSNASLALASRRFENQLTGTKSSIPSCITDYFLGTLIWLNTPNKAEEITKKKLIADCYALTKPNEKLIKKYLEEVDRLRAKGRINDDQHLLLRTDQAAFNILTSRTYGDVREFSTDLPFEILEQIKADMQREADEKAQEKINEKDAKYQEEKLEREKAVEERDKTKETLETVTKTVLTQDEVLQKRALSISKVIIYSVMAIITLVLAWLSYLQYTVTDWDALTLSIFILFAVIGLANWVLGFYFLGYAKNLIPKLQGGIYLWLTGRR
jgi:hypothetical protein